MENLKFRYVDFDFIHPIGENPYMIIRIKIILPKQEQNKYIVIPNSRYKVNLYSVENSEGQGQEEIGFIGEFSSTSEYFGSSTTVELFIPFNFLIIEKMQEIRLSNKFVSFLIKPKGIYFVHDNENNTCGSVSEIKTDAKVRRKIGDREFDSIIFNTDEFNEIIKSFGKYELLRIEIPIRTNIQSNFNDFNNALKEIETARNDLFEINYEGVLISIRNVLNHLLERGQDGKNRLKNNIKELIINNYRTELKGIYEHILEKLEINLNGLLQILNKFLHEDRNKLKANPMREDVEMIFYTATFFINYLSQILSLEDGPEE